MTVTLYEAREYFTTLSGNFTLPVTTMDTSGEAVYKLTYLNGVPYPYPFTVSPGVISATGDSGGNTVCLLRQSQVIDDDTPKRFGPNPGVYIERRLDNIARTLQEVRDQLFNRAVPCDLASVRINPPEPGWLGGLSDDTFGTIVAGPSAAFSVADGGTGAKTAAAARTALGLGSAASRNVGENEGNVVASPAPPSSVRIVSFGSRGGLPKHGAEESMFVANSPSDGYASVWKRPLGRLRMLVSKDVSNVSSVDIYQPAAPYYFEQHELILEIVMYIANAAGTPTLWFGWYNAATDTVTTITSANYDVSLSGHITNGTAITTNSMGSTSVLLAHNPSTLMPAESGWRTYHGRFRVTNPVAAGIAAYPEIRGYCSYGTTASSEGLVTIKSLFGRLKLVLGSPIARLLLSTGGVNIVSGRIRLMGVIR